MAVEIRAPAEDELRAAMVAAEGAFGGELEDEDWERERVRLSAARALAAFDGGTAVGLAGAYAFELTVPGGRLPCAGVTWVGVLPSHRRRGILRDFMRRQLDDVNGWGEQIAALWASESAIYGRFGYGLAAPGLRAKSDRARFELRDDEGPQGSVRLVDLETACGLFPPVYERLRTTRAGMLTRSEHWWREHTLADPKSWRRGASQKFYVAVDLDGAVEGYALYRVKGEWEEGMPKGEVRVVEAFATSARAERELWRFLHGIDLTVRVILQAARYRVGEGAGRTDDEADLALDVADLASAYLGAFDFHRLVHAGRAEERSAGAAEAATLLFRTDLPPYCPEVF